MVSLSMTYQLSALHNLPGKVVCVHVCAQKHLWLWLGFKKKYLRRGQSHLCYSIDNFIVYLSFESCFKFDVEHALY